MGSQHSLSHSHTSILTRPNLTIVLAVICVPGQSPFQRELRKALNADWKYLAVGISEWSSSFQHILQCGMRRIVPTFPSVQTFFIHHAANKVLHIIPSHQSVLSRTHTRCRLPAHLSPLTPNPPYRDQRRRSGGCGPNCSLCRRGLTWCTLRRSRQYR